MPPITSLSSYSKLIRLLEYGYNRDGLSCPPHQGATERWRTTHGGRMSDHRYAYII